MTDWRALCAELLDAEQDQTVANDGSSDRFDMVAARARAALAQPEPKGLTVMEIIELADEIEAAELGQVDLVRAALARWGRQQPISVSERLPGPGDCDAEGRCWWWRTDDADEWWELLGITDAREHNARCGSARYTHWLPAHALPIPRSEND